MASEVLLKVFDNEALAQMWAGILADQGIRSMVRQVRTSLPNVYHGPFVPHALYVMPDDAPRAQALLDEDVSR